MKTRSIWARAISDAGMVFPTGRQIMKDDVCLVLALEKIQGSDNLCQLDVLHPVHNILTFYLYQYEVDQCLIDEMAIPDGSK